MLFRSMTERLPLDLADFGRLNPDVRLSVQERWSEEIVHQLLASEADLGIVVEGVMTEGLESYPYTQDRIAVIMKPEHPLAKVKDFKFIDVLDLDVIALESASSMMRLLTAQAVIVERTLQLRVQVRSFEAVCRMVQADFGVGILPFDAPFHVLIPGRPGEVDRRLRLVSAPSFGIVGQQVELRLVIEDLGAPIVGRRASATRW